MSAPAGISTTTPVAIRVEIELAPEQVTSSQDQPPAIFSDGIAAKPRDYEGNTLPPHRWAGRVHHPGVKVVGGRLGPSALKGKLCHR